MLGRHPQPEAHGVIPNPKPETPNPEHENFPRLTRIPGHKGKDQDPYLHSLAFRIYIRIWGPRLWILLEEFGLGRDRRVKYFLYGGTLGQIPAGSGLALQAFLALLFVCCWHVEGLGSPNLSLLTAT